MKAAGIPAVLLAMFLPAGGSAEAESPASEIPWLTGTSKAMVAATESRSPILVDLWAIWCEPCDVMEQTTYRDPSVVQAISGLVPLKIDVDADTVFAQRYEVDQYPTTLFLDGQGREITRLPGLVEAGRMLEAIEVVRGGFGAYLEQVENRDDPVAMAEVGDYLLRAGNADGALPLLRRALKLMKGQPPEMTEGVELSRAEALLESGRTGAAVKELERLSSSAADPEVRGRADRVMERLGQD